MKCIIYYADNDFCWCTPVNSPLNGAELEEYFVTQKEKFMWGMSGVLVTQDSDWNEVREALKNSIYWKTKYGRVDLKDWLKEGINHTLKEEKEKNYKIYTREIKKHDWFVNINTLEDLESILEDTRITFSKLENDECINGAKYCLVIN